MQQNSKEHNQPSFPSTKIHLVYIFPEFFLVLEIRDRRLNFGKRAGLLVYNMAMTITQTLYRLNTTVPPLIYLNTAVKYWLARKPCEKETIYLIHLNQLSCSDINTFIYSRSVLITCWVLNMNIKFIVIGFVKQFYCYACYRLPNKCI